MKYLLIGLLCLLPTFSFAGEAKDIADDPVMERRMIQLAEKVRCLVCQSEPVSTSHSEWSIDVRQIMREKMKAGATDQQILDLLVERFGKSVLFDPPVDKETLPLWSAPFILLLLGGIFLAYQLKKRRGQVVEATLTPQEAWRAEQLLNEPVAAEPASSNPSVGHGGENTSDDSNHHRSVRSLSSTSPPKGESDDVSLRDAPSKDIKA